MHKELNIIYLKEVDSTNKYALRNFEEFSDGTLIVAEEQSAGRGRHERRWVSPPGTNIYASMVIKNPGNNPAQTSMILSLAALAVLRESAPDVKFWLKWPNDIFCREKKIAGILCESATFAEKRVSGIVGGIGININMSADIIEKIDQPATSLKYETGLEFNCKKIVKKLAKSLNKYYSIYSISPKVLFDMWKNENLLIGQSIEINTGDKELKGRITDLGYGGELIFETSGETIKLFSGDVKINKASIDFDKL
jgi:BirA family biotin operon repressor/biotin-[acetyl-CoA-carboxylase] ligase